MVHKCLLILTPYTWFITRVKYNNTSRNYLNKYSITFLIFILYLSGTPCNPTTVILYNLFLMSLKCAHKAMTDMFTCLRYYSFSPHQIVVLFSKRNRLRLWKINCYSSLVRSNLHVIAKHVTRKPKRLSSQRGMWTMFLVPSSSRRICFWIIGTLAKNCLSTSKCHLLFT